MYQICFQKKGLLPFCSSGRSQKIQNNQRTIIDLTMIGLIKILYFLRSIVTKIILQYEMLNYVI